MFAKKLVTLAALSLLNSHASAEVKTSMDEMLGYILDLKPYITSEKAYTAPENGPVISKTLKKMIVLSEKIKHEDKIKKTALEVPAMSLNEQLKDTASVFSKGNKTYSLWLLRTNLGNCVACHTQLPAQSTQFTTGKKSKYMVNTFQEGEFLYVIRNFDKALEMYNKSLTEFPENKISAQDLDTVITRKVFYYTRVKRDLAGLSQSLNADLANKNLLPGTSVLLKSYSQAAQTLAKQKVPSLKTDKEVRRYAETVLKKEMSGELNYEDATKNLQNLQLSGFLYEYLDKNQNTALKPDIYYWLSFCESRWEKGLQDSLPESYLKKCVNEFPQSAVAPKCLKEYEDLVTFGFTGSSGTNIPADVEAELQNLRDKVNPKK